VSDRARKKLPLSTAETAGETGGLLGKCCGDVHGRRAADHGVVRAASLSCSQNVRRRLAEVWCTKVGTHWSGSVTGRAAIPSLSEWRCADGPDRERRRPVRQNHLIGRLRCDYRREDEPHVIDEYCVVPAAGILQVIKAQCERPIKVRCERKGLIREE